MLWLKLRCGKLINVLVDASLPLTFDLKHSGLYLPRVPSSHSQGALDDVEAAFGMHVMPHIRTGVLATRAGTILAGSLSFHVGA